MRELKFRFWDKDLKKLIYRKPAYNDFSHPNILPLQYTGLKDKKGNEIYDGDVLSDFTETDEGLVQSKMQVFWNDPTGTWHLDNSYHQDKTSSTELWFELNDFNYEIIGNIYENPELLTAN